MRNSDCWYVGVCDNDCSGACIRYMEMKYLMDNSNIPKAKQVPSSLRPPNVDYDAFCKLADIKSNIKDFVKDGKSVYITSSTTGNGKTSWAIKLLSKYFDEIWAGNGFRVRGLFVHVPTFLLKCKEFGVNDPAFEEFKRLLTTVDIVVWDDVASNELSTYDCTQLIRYIDSRIANQQTNIYTGNLPTQELMQKAIGAKLTSRIFSSATKIIVFRGGDKR